MQRTTWIVWVAAASAAGSLACTGWTGTAAADEASPIRAAAAAAQSAAVSSVGSLAFTVDGRPKSFTHLTPAENVYAKISSTIRARPAAGTREALTINFISIDLRTLQYPAVLPPPRDALTPANPLAAMAMVGFIYQDEEGREWAGPGSIRLASFGDDGTLDATFTTVSLPDVKKQQPNIVLADGTVQVRIGR